MSTYALFNAEADEVETVFKAADDVAAADHVARMIRAEMAEVPEFFEDGSEPYNYRVFRVRKRGPGYAEWEDEDFVFSVRAVWSSYHRLVAALAAERSMVEFERELEEAEEIAANFDGRARPRGRLH